MRWRHHRKPPHGIADRDQPSHEPPPDIQHADPRSGDDADKGDDQEHDPAVIEGYAQGRGAVFDPVLGILHKVGDSLVQVTLDGDVLVYRRFGPRSDERLAGVPRENAVGSGPERHKLRRDPGDVVIGQRGDRAVQSIRRRFKKILDVLEFRRLPQCRGLADQADHEVRPCRGLDRHTRIRKLREPVDKLRTRLVQSVIQRHDLGTEIAAFGNDVFQRRKICVQAL